MSRWKWGSNVTFNHSHTHLADHLVPNWVLGKPASFDHSVRSLLNPAILLEVSVTTGVAAWTTEQRSIVPMTAMLMNLDGSVYHWWLNPMEPGELKEALESIFPASFLICHLLFQGKVSGAY